MKSFILVTACCCLSFAHLTNAQYNYDSTPTATTITPEMAASAASVSNWAAQFTNPIQSSGSAAGDASSVNDGSQSANEAGASGSDNQSITLSKGGIIAIAVVVSCVVIFGIVSSILFYLAKKRSWEVRASIRKSAKRVATALTPRRSEFPRNVRNPKRNSNGMSRIDEIPPTPRLTRHDIEKGHAKAHAIEMREPGKWSKWGRKTDR